MNASAISNIGNIADIGIAVTEIRGKLQDLDSKYITMSRLKYHLNCV